MEILKKGPVVIAAVLPPLEHPEEKCRYALTADDVDGPYVIGHPSASKLSL